MKRMALWAALRPLICVWPVFEPLQAMHCCQKAERELGKVVSQVVRVVRSIPSLSY